VHDLKGEKAPRHKGMWDGSAEIDVYYEVGDDIYCMELKVERAQACDVYQLLMDWDKLVIEGKQPKKGILVAEEIPATVAKAIAHVNGLKDGNGKNYESQASLWPR
jgi:hypothetical protein